MTCSDGAADLQLAQTPSATAPVLRSVPPIVNATITGRSALRLPRSLGGSYTPPSSSDPFAPGTLDKRADRRLQRIGGGRRTPPPCCTRFSTTVMTSNSAFADEGLDEGGRPPVRKTPSAVVVDDHGDCGVPRRLRLGHLVVLPAFLQREVRRGEVGDRRALVVEHGYLHGPGRRRGHGKRWACRVQN